MSGSAAKAKKLAGGILVVLAGLFVAVGGAGASPEGGRLYAALSPVTARPGLDAAAAEPGNPPGFQAGTRPGRDGWSPSPFVAGLLSALVPGAGQLAMGQDRGWVYLGLETAGWFSHWALQEAGDQSKTDYGEFADAHWAWARYDTTSSCGEGLGPVDFEEERRALEEAERRSREEFYDDIGRLDVYACGWDDLGSRDRFRGMQGHADALFHSARTVFSLVFLNHVVSALDAAKSAANRRKAREPDLSWNWGVGPAADGTLAMRVAVNRRF